MKWFKEISLANKLVVITIVIGVITLVVSVLTTTQRNNEMSITKQSSTGGE